jgi:hypothetical protein
MKYIIALGVLFFIALTTLGVIHSVNSVDPFNKFLVDNKCKLVVDFGTPVYVQTPGSGFSPKFQRVYTCENYPQAAILN